MEGNDNKFRKWACAFCQCKKSFQCFSHLARHIIFHIGEKPYSCKFCGISFYEKHHLMEHRSVLHPNPKSLTESGGLQKKFKCITCEHVFATRRSLRSHQLTHNSEKSFKCDQCPATFAQPRYLKKHKNTHEDKTTLFECQKCGEVIRRTMVGNHVLQCQPEMFKKKTTMKKTENQLMELKNEPEATETQRQGHEEIQLLVCNCEEKFGGETELMEHQGSHYDNGIEDDHDHATNDGMELKINTEEAQNQDAIVTTATVTKKGKGRKKIKYKCLFCPAKFRAMNTLETHFETVHKGNVELDYDDEDENDDLNANNDVKTSSPCKPKKRKLTTDEADVRGHED